MRFCRTRLQNHPPHPLLRLIEFRLRLGAHARGQRGRAVDKELPLLSTSGIEFSEARLFGDLVDTSSLRNEAIDAPRRLTATVVDDTRW